MRDDMAKVIVERPRTGGGEKFPRGSVRQTDRLAPEEWPRREGIRRAWGGGSKHLNENLAPLRRYLRSQVGRPWDEVYGEICRRIDRDSAVQLHVWQHLSREVCVDPHVVRGDVAGSGQFGYPGPLYVDPKTGVLCYDEGRRRRYDRPKPQGPKGRIKVDDSREYRLIEGVWYELTLAPIPAWADRVDDVVFRKKCFPAPRSVLESFYGRPTYAVKKRQLNSKEIRRLPGHA